MTTTSIPGLAGVIQDAAKFYYEGTPIMSDVEFEQLVEELRGLDPMNPVLLVPGWGYKPGRRKALHKHGLLIGSLDEPKGLDALKRFFAGSVTTGSRFIWMPKLDGMTVVLYYDDRGRFERAVTRGDGTEGMDISSKIPHLKTKIPAKVPSYGLPIAVRGEAVMLKADFFTSYADEAEKEAEDATRSRNIVAGILNRDEDSVEDLGQINIVAFDVLTGLPEGSSKTQALAWLDAKGFHRVTYFIESLSEENLAMAREKFVDDYYFPTDGIVISTDDGYRTDDEAICAYKFPGATALGTVKRVSWRLTPTGKFAPTVEFETPVQLTGAKFTRATAHNFAFCDENGIGPGAVVEFTRSGDVIPKIVAVEVKASKSDRPYVCPVCVENTEVDGKDLICPNAECKGQTLERLHLFVSLAAPIDRLARKTWDDFFEANGLKSVTDFYVAAAEGKLVPVGGDSTQALFYEATNALRTVNVTTLLKALVTGVGDVAAPAIASVLDLQEVTVGAAKAYNLTFKGDLEAAKKAGRVTSVAFERTLQASFYLQEVMTCIALAGGTVVLDGPQDKGEGPVIVMTGKLSKPRPELAKEFEALGCVVLNDMKKGVDFLVTDDPSPTSGKGKKAVQYGIEIVTETDFRRLLKVLTEGKA